MMIKDRFYFNQYFPIPHLDEDFIEKFVPAEKHHLLLDKHLTKCTLFGFISRHAFHIFDKTNRTWITSAKDLGYQAAFGVEPIMQ
jgi:hypothetical protein